MAGRMFTAALVAVALALAGLIVAATIPRSESVSPATAADALWRDPLDLPALRVKALATADTQQSRRIFEFILGRTWRDGPTDAWLLRDRLVRGDLAGSLACADALLRLDGEGKTRPALFSLLTAATDYVEARPPLAARLSAHPWWRKDFLQYLDIHGDPAAATLLMADLAAGSARATPAETSPLIDRLVAARDYTGAVEAWRQIAPRGPGATARLRDGNFTQAWDLTPFTWRPATGIGATSVVGEESDAIDNDPTGSHVLRIDYDGFSEPSLPAQLLVLPVGRWGLNWRVRGDAQADRALYWRIRCADTGAVLAGTPNGVDAAAVSGWRSRTLTFITPPDGCHGQWLELIAVAGERRAQVTGWFADFSILPINGR
jgi:hypothetical protein